MTHERNSIRLSLNLQRHLKSFPEISQDFWLDVEFLTGTIISCSSCCLLSSREHNYQSAAGQWLGPWANISSLLKAWMTDKGLEASMPNKKKLIYWKRRPAQERCQSYNITDDNTIRVWCLPFFHFLCAFFFPRVHSFPQVRWSELMNIKKFDDLVSLFYKHGTNSILSTRSHFRKNENSSFPILFLTDPLSVACLTSGCPPQYSQADVGPSLKGA